MRILFSILLTCIVLKPVWAQNQLFPVAKNGKWGLVSASGKFILDYRYDYIDYVPAAQKYIYDFQGKKGLIASNGTILSAPLFADINPFDSVFTSFKTNLKWDLKQNGSPLFPAEFDSVACVNQTTFILYKGKTGKLYQGENQKETEKVFLRASNYQKNVLIAEQENHKKTIVNQNTLEILVEDVHQITPIGFNYALLDRGDSKLLLNLKTEKVVGESMDEISFLFGNYFKCKKNEKQLLFSVTDGKYFEMTSADAVWEVDYPFVFYTKSNRMGIWDLARNKDFIPAQYEGLEKVDQVYVATDMGRYGVFSSSGQLIVPVIYADIAIHDQLYIVSQNGKQGVIGKNGQTVVPIDYERINVYTTYIKCYSPNAITVIKLDENGGYKSQKTYTDYFSIDIEKERMPRKRSSDMTFGSGRDNSNYYEHLGWYRPILKRMVDDSLVEYRGRWGLKDTADSVVIRPYYADIVVKERYGFTEAYTKPLNNSGFSFSNNMIQFAVKYGDATYANYQPIFHLIDIETRKRKGKTSFLALKTGDFNHRALARGFDGDLILVDRNAETHWKDLRFYGSYKEDILRICQGGERVFTSSETGNTVCRTADFLNLTGAVQTKTAPMEEFMDIKGGNWFYLDSTGKQLNETPFEMAEEFLHHLAIVKQNGKWGVVDTGMHIIVPFEYGQIERVIVDKQSYFKISNRVNENYIYTKNSGTLRQSPVAELTHFYNGKWFAQAKNNSKWALVDTTLKPITPYTFDRIEAFENGYATVMKAGKKTVIDENGREVLPYSKCKRIDALGYERFAITGKRGITVVNITGDTLLVENNCKTVVATSANYVIYQSRGKELNLLNFKNANTLPKKYHLISYSLKDDLFLMQKDGKNRLFSMETGKFVGKALPNIVSIGEGSMIYRNDQGLLGYLSFSGDTLCPPQFKKLENSVSGWAFGQKEKEKGLVDINGNFLFEKPIFRVNTLGENFIIMTSDGVGLIDPAGKLLVPAEYLRIEPHNAQFYKAIKMDNTCDIYTCDGTRVNDKPFRNINAISAAAYIVTHNGFDYLYNGTLNKSLSFQHINPVSSNLYLLHENKLSGIYNGQGELIIPIQYHKIDVVHNHFQVSFFNSFGYYSLDGKVLADPREVS